MNYVFPGDVSVIKDIVVKVVGSSTTIYVDPTAMLNIVGTEMDWKEDETSSEFTFINPKSKGSCGCGESFNV